MYLDGGENDLDITNAELVTRLSKLPLKYEPGTTWWYSRSTDVLGRLIEVVSGMTLGAASIVVRDDVQDARVAVNCRVRWTSAGAATCAAPEV